MNKTIRTIGIVNHLWHGADYDEYYLVVFNCPLSGNHVSNMFEKTDQEIIRASEIGEV